MHQWPGCGTAVTLGTAGCTVRYTVVAYRYMGACSMVVYMGMYMGACCQNWPFLEICLMARLKSAVFDTFGSLNMGAFWHILAIFTSF